MQQPVISTLTRPRQKDHCECQAGLWYIVSSGLAKTTQWGCLKKKKESHPRLWAGRLTTVKMEIFFKLSYRFSTLLSWKLPVSLQKSVSFWKVNSQSEQANQSRKRTKLEDLHFSLKTCNTRYTNSIIVRLTEISNSALK